MIDLSCMFSSASVMHVMYRDAGIFPCQKIHQLFNIRFLFPIFKAIVSLNVSKVNVSSP